MKTMKRIISNWKDVIKALIRNPQKYKQHSYAVNSVIRRFANHINYANQK